MTGNLKRRRYGRVYMNMAWPQQAADLADGHALVGKSLGALLVRYTVLSDGCDWLTQSRAAKGAIFVLDKKVRRQAA